MNPNESVIGRCSICGGDVVTHTGAWWGINPPIPYCVSCGAVEDKGLPEIKMRPAKALEQRAISQKEFVVVPDPITPPDPGWKFTC